MKVTRKILEMTLATAIAGALFLAAAVTGHAQGAAGQSGATRHIGAIKAINGKSITLVPDSGPEVNVTIQDTTRIVRIAPGEKTLKNAILLQSQDLQVGDRILVGGKASEDGKGLVASSIVVMKRSDVEARQAQEQKDWQGGAGGLVTGVDAATGTVTISAAGFGGTKSVAVRTSKNTVIRRYAPDSVKFSDTKPSTLQDIHPGDQLRARGERNPEGTEVTAEEIVAGSFRNVAGAISSVDAGASTIRVQDLLSKKNVLVKVTAESQLRMLPEEMAQRIAVRLKGTAADALSANGAPAHPEAGGMGPRANGNGRGTGDFQQMLSRLPAATLADLHKGDVVMIVATQGSGAEGTAITLLGGVEPILRAAPSAGEAMVLAPWSLGGGAPSGDTGN